MNISVNDEKQTYNEHLIPRSNKSSLIAKMNVGLKLSRFRWLFLAFTCLNCVGSFFCFDNPQALQTHILDKFKINTFQFNLLYSVYAFPNIILPLFGGLIVDQLGVRLGISLFSFLLIIGQAVVTFGAISSNFTLMLIGRVIFGFGGENLNVASCAITAKWFGGKEIAFAFGISLCVSRLGSALNSVLSPKLYNISHELYVPLLFGAFLCLFSWLMGLLMNYYDKKADEEESFSTEVQPVVEKFKLADIKSFSLLYYLIILNGFFLYGGFYGLNNNLNDLMVARFGFDPDYAGNFIPIVYLCAAVLIPIFGIGIDHFGRRALLTIYSAVLFVGVHLAIAFMPGTTSSQPDYSIIGPLFGVGIFYATFAAIFWPCIPLVVKESLTGTAFGVATALQNLMLTLIPLALGYIHDNTTEDKRGYFWTEIVLAILVGCGLILTIFIYILDLKTGGKLDRPITLDQKVSNKLSIVKSFVRYIKILFVLDSLIFIL